MKPTPYPRINELLDELLFRIQGVLGEELVGLHLFGSLVDVGLDDELSDIDLLAVVSHDVDDAQLEALLSLHDEFVVFHPQWEDRIEVAYVSADALRTFKERSSRIAIISPGEPLYFKEAGRDWLMNWYLVREGDATLFGPPPKVFIGPISKAEFIEAVRANARSWERLIDQLHDRKSQSYAILTMCRALYAHRTGEHTSKEEAALWAQRALPEWADLIRDALQWRRSSSEAERVQDATVADTERFLNQVNGLFPPAL